MELIESRVFWMGLLEIIWVNVMLSGDNAVVIALASRRLPPVQQRQSIIWGTTAAIGMRVVLTLFAVELLQLPFLKSVGATLLLWVGVRLLGDDGSDTHGREAGSLFSAIKTILLADLATSLDNVLAVAAAAETAPAGSAPWLVVFGLSLSIPVVIFGSNTVVRLMKAFPHLVTLGAMLLGWIAGELLGREAYVQALLPAERITNLLLPLSGALVALLLGKRCSRRPR